MYVGTANGTRNGSAPAPNGGILHKIDLARGTIVATFAWPTDRSEGDTHGFTGMGCTPAVVAGKVYFSAFNGRLYCLDAATLALLWVTDLRVADPDHNQPVSNIGANPALRQAEGWCSPLVVNDRVSVRMGEGENPDLYAFLYCLNAATGKVIWIFCTNQFEAGKDNAPNVLPADAVDVVLPPGFSTTTAKVVAKGCVVWSAISYDRGLNRLYCATGNPQPDSKLPAPGYANSILALDATSGTLVGKVQAVVGSSYRPSDVDVDFGTSPTLFTRQGRRGPRGCRSSPRRSSSAGSRACSRWPARASARACGRGSLAASTPSPAGGCSPSRSPRSSATSPERGQR